MKTQRNHLQGRGPSRLYAVLLVGLAGATVQMAVACSSNDNPVPDSSGTVQPVGATVASSSHSSTSAVSTAVSTSASTGASTTASASAGQGGAGGATATASASTGQGGAASASTGQGGAGGATTTASASSAASASTGQGGAGGGGPIDNCTPFDNTKLKYLKNGVLPALGTTLTP